MFKKGQGIQKALIKELKQGVRMVTKFYSLLSNNLYHQVHQVISSVIYSTILSLGNDTTYPIIIKHYSYKQGQLTDFHWLEIFSFHTVYHTLVKKREMNV